MADLLIQNTNFSIQFVLDKIRSGSAAGEGHSTEWLVAHRLEGFDACDVTNGSAFMSAILRLNLRWKEPSSDLPSSVIMKVPGPKYKEIAAMSGEEAGEEDPMDEGVHEFLAGAHMKEIAFYQHFPLYDGGLKLPKFYFGSAYSRTHSDGLIIMEDLTTRGVPARVLPGFNEQQVLALLDEVARVHAASWKQPDWQKAIGVEQYSLSGSQFIEGMRQKAIELKKIDPVQFGTLVDRLLPMFEEQYCEMSVYNSDKYGFPPCVVHADLWAANVLWERDVASGGTASNRLCAIIDWQTVHAGNPCEDILRILSLNTSGPYRRANTTRLVEYYAQRVAVWMGAEEQVPFTHEQLWEAYKHSLPFSMMYMCFGVPMYVHMDSVVGSDPAQREQNRMELLQRMRMFLEDTAEAFGL